MARAETITLLPLDRYAEIMTIPLTHFNQMAGEFAPLRGGCKNATVWDQNAREDLAWSIEQAELLISQQLGFWPAPKFVTEEEVYIGLNGVRSDWTNAEVKTENSYLDGFGSESLTLKQADAGVEYSVSNNNPFGRKNQALIGTAIYDDLPACGSACEVAVFFRVADGAEDAADLRWEIKPIKVDIDGSTMRITADASLFLRPDLMDLNEDDCRGSEDESAWIYDADPTNLVTKVDVYCRTIDAETPVTLRWDGICDCTVPCDHETQTACAHVTDKRRSFFIPRPASWNGTANVYLAPKYSSPPESVQANYRAGYPLRNCRMDSRLERAIVKLANALMPEPPCGFCDMAQTRWKRDRTDIDPLTPEAASMPWDLYTQGALEAWRIVKMMASGRGAKMGR